MHSERPWSSSTAHLHVLQNRCLFRRPPEAQRSVSVHIHLNGRRSLEAHNLDAAIFELWGRNRFISSIMVQLRHLPAGGDCQNRRPNRIKHSDALYWSELVFRQSSVIICITLHCLFSLQILSTPQRVSHPGGILIGSPFTPHTTPVAMVTQVHPPEGDEWTPG